MVVAIEDSGFEVRDQIMWLYGSGFPKSLNVGKAIESSVKTGKSNSKSLRVTEQDGDGEPYQLAGKNNGIMGETVLWEREEFAPATSEAQQWQGWGTALKPAHEPICVARKPLIGTVANNVLTYGTGALNIDGSRVGTSDTPRMGNTETSKATQTAYGTGWQKSGTTPPEGRWPANVIHDGSDEVLAGFPNEVGRFFYCSKASKSERNAGLEGLPEREGAGGMNGTANQTPLTGAGNVRNNKAQNFHPTVKPLALMRYLIKLVTPPNGVVLDPFLGSGTTAVAATLEGFDWIGCEMTEDYWPIIEARVEWAKTETKKSPTTLF
jgi:site-specific DNA-methyltransferase (adenine-specific)